MPRKKLNPVKYDLDRNTNDQSLVLRKYTYDINEPSKLIRESYAPINKNQEKMMYALLGVNPKLSQKNMKNVYDYLETIEFVSTKRFL